MPFSKYLFSAFSLTHSLEIGHRQSRPVNECFEEEKGRVWVGKNQTQDEAWSLAKERTPGQGLPLAGFYTTTPC